MTELILLQSFIVLITSIMLTVSLSLPVAIEYMFIQALCVGVFVINLFTLKNFIRNKLSEEVAEKRREG